MSGFRGLTFEKSLKAFSTEAAPKKSANKENGMSGYNIDFAMSATLSSNVVEEMVRKVVEEQTGKKVASVTFKHRDISNERERFSVAGFDGCVVTFVADKAKTEYAGIYAPGTK
jgi:hypothetical protein